MKRAWAGMLTIAVMGLLLWSGARRDPSTPGETASSNDSTPVAANPAEITVHNLLSSAATGNVSAYLAGFTGPLRDRLSREVAERGRTRFSEDLRTAAEARKSHAVFAAEPDGPDAATVTVESVYPDRNERQNYRVERTATGWFVAGVETVKSHLPRAKYGSPANYVAPEGPPVPVGVTVETGDEPDPLP